MVRIGAVNLDTSHPVAFAKWLEERDRARYVAVYDDSFRSDDEVAAFVRRFGLEGRCGSLAELADRCDAVFLHGCDWDRHLELAEPVLARGKPVFVDKPIAGKARDCARLEELAASGAAILGSSSMRYAEEVVAFVSHPEQERGAVLHAHGTVGTDEFNYAIHVVEALGGLLGPGFTDCTFSGAAIRDGTRCELYTLRHGSGATASYTVHLGTWQPCAFVVSTTKTTAAFAIDTGRLYGALLERTLDAVERGEPALAPVTDLTESVRVLLAARISRERGGGAVALDDVPVDDPGYDGAEFAKGYAAATRDIRTFWGETP